MREVAIRERKLRPRGQLLQDADRLLCRLERLGTATDVSEKSRKRPHRLAHAPPVVELSIKVEGGVLRLERFVELAAQVARVRSPLLHAREHFVRRVLSLPNRARHVSSGLTMRAQR